MNMRALWRLAIWGTSAAAALVLVVVASYTETGSRRIATAMASPGGKDAPRVQVASRSPEAEAETRRLTEAVRTLTADRDRLAARLGAVERNLEDMTGSIRRQAGMPNPPAAPAAMPPASPPAREAAALPTASPASRPAGPPAAASPASRPASPPAAEPVTATQEAATPAAPAGESPEPAKAELGIDVGGATSSDGIRALWNSTKGHHASLIDGLHPVVATRENSRTKSKELRLIVGPVDSIETASQLCATLTAARRYCQPVAFEGQKLAEAPERKPAPKSAAPAPAARLPWPFR